MSSYEECACQDGCENCGPYIPTKEEVRTWFEDEALALMFDRLIFDIQEDAWEDGYQAGVHDGRHETVRETTNPHTDWTR